MKSLKKNIFFNIINDASNILFPLITSMYVSRIIMPEGVGLVSYAQNIASYFVTFAALGLPTYGIREIAKVQNDNTLSNKTFTELFIINAITTAVSTAAYAILVMSPLGSGFDKRLMLCFGISILFNFINIEWLYKGKEEYVYISLRSVIIKIISLVLIFVFVRTKEDYINYSIIIVVALGGNYIFNIIHARKIVKFSFKNLEFKKHINPLVVLALSLFLSSIYSKLDITMLGSMSTKEATGLYANAHKIVEMIITACSAISAVFLPRLSYYYKNDQKEFTRLIDKGVRILAFISVPAAVAVFVLAPQAIELLFGKEFVPGSSTVRILSVLIMVKSFGNLLCYQLVICTGNEKKRLPAYALANVANIALNALLIPKMAQNGAALASVASEVIVNAYQFFKMRKIVIIPVSKSALLQSVLSSAVMGVSLFFLAKINLPLLASVVVCVIAGLGIYLLLNLLMKNEFLSETLSAFIKKHKGAK
ncbi:MAG: flippase [Eubacterium sp.]|nr:flippase [Eubacterium sp.]